LVSSTILFTLVVALQAIMALTTIPAIPATTRISGPCFLTFIMVLFIAPLTLFTISVLFFIVFILLFEFSEMVDKMLCIPHNLFEVLNAVFLFPTAGIFDDIAG